MYLSAVDQEALAAAVRRLERPSFAGRLAALAGRPVGLIQRALPAAASTVVATVAKHALERALDVALFSLKNRRLTGGRKLHSRLACLEVLALGASTPNREMPESDYFAVRAQLAQGVVEVADFALDKGVVREGAPAVVRFVAQIASRFGIVVSQKLTAQAVAVVGAVCGAALNLAFVEHFQDLARGHFTVRRLERVYGADAVRAEYDRIKSELGANPWHHGGRGGGNLDQRRASFETTAARSPQDEEYS